MVILSYKQGEWLSSSSITVDFLPIELLFIAEALGNYCRGNSNLTINRMLDLVKLQNECDKAVDAFIDRREAWRKERRS